MIVTSAGETEQGYCVTVNATEVSLREKDNVVKVAKDRIGKLVMVRKNHPIQKLGHDLIVGLSLRSDVTVESRRSNRAYHDSGGYRLGSRCRTVLPDRRDQRQPDLESRDRDQVDQPTRNTAVWAQRLGMEVIFFEPERK